jgi:hypothetical protein
MEKYWISKKLSLYNNIRRVFAKLTYTIETKLLLYFLPSNLILVFSVKVTTPSVTAKSVPSFP